VRSGLAGDRNDRTIRWRARFGGGDTKAVFDGVGTNSVRRRASCAPATVKTIEALGYAKTF
jgi:hypothetical protein